MAYKKLVEQKIKEFQIEEFIKQELRHVGLSSVKLQKTPLGEKIVVSASRPGLVVGRKGQNIKKITSQLKKKFSLENPQIEINELTNPNLDATVVAERIANSLERFGSSRFKAIGHRVLSDVMGAGALGVEVLVSGKVPSARARRWRFYQGYLKKSGNIATTGVHTAYAAAQLKTGTVGIQVRIMPPIELPDKIEVRGSEEAEEIAKQQEEAAAQKKPKKKKAKRKAKPKAEKKVAEKKEEKKEAPAAKETPKEAPQAAPVEEKKEEVQSQETKQEQEAPKTE